jgi:hypothetical protein
MGLPPRSMPPNDLTSFNPPTKKPSDLLNLRSATSTLSVFDTAEVHTQRGGGSGWPSSLGHNHANNLPGSPRCPTPTDFMSRHPFG